MHYVNLSAALLIAVGLAAMMRVRCSRQPGLTLRAVVGGLIGGNLLTALAAAAMLFLAPGSALAQTTTQSASNTALGAALATGLACIGAGIAVGIAGAAAIGGITEKPEILGRTLIFVGLAEGIAIYGLIISFMILNA